MVLFISDLHLHPSRPAAAALFRGFLAGPARSADTLWILGDLFEYWAGDDDDDPFNAAVCAELRALADGGTRICFICGNRDFLIGRGFAETARTTLAEEPQVVDLDGQATLLLHGDTLCTDDTAYQTFRATVRTADFRRDFLAKPLAERKAFIGDLRQRSESEKQVKPAAIMDTNAQAVAAAFRRHGVARMIHGHTHRQARHGLSVDGRACERWVLGDWRDDAGNYLECSRDGWAFRPWTGRR